MLYSLNLSPKNGLMITNSTYNIIGRESADKEGLKLYDWLDLLGMIYKTSPRSKRKHIMPTWKNCKQFYDQLNEAEIRKYRLNQKLGNQVTITDRLLKRFFEKSYLKEKKEIHTKINDLKILINRCKIDLKRLSKRYDLPNIDELIQNV